VTLWVSPILYRTADRVGYRSRTVTGIARTVPHGRSCGKFEKSTRYSMYQGLRYDSTSILLLSVQEPTKLYEPLFRRSTNHNFATHAKFRAKSCPCTMEMRGTVPAKWAGTQMQHGLQVYVITLLEGQIG